MAILEYRQRVRRDTAANFTSYNPTLLLGEIALETDTKKMKIGDGVTAWAGLDYDILTLADVGVPGGLVPLNALGLIDAAYIDQVAVASTTAFNPSGTISATDAQSAIQELDAEKEPLITPSTTDTFYRGDKAFTQVTTLNVHVDPSRKIGNPQFVDTQSEINNYLFSAGVLNGCELTDNGNGTINIATGSAVLRNGPLHTNILHAVEVPAQTNLTLLDNSINYVYLSWNGGSPIFETSASLAAFNDTDKCITYLVYRSGNFLNVVDVRGQNLDMSTKSRRLFLDFSRFIHTEGGTALGNPSGTTVSVSAGKFYFMVTDIEHPAFDTSVAGTANENVFSLWYRNGVGGWTQQVNQKTVDTTTYDNNSGTLVPLNNNQYGVTWFYIVHDSPSTLHAVKGQGSYASLAAAQAATPPASLPGLLSTMGSLIGKVAYVKSNATFDAVYSAFLTQFGTSAATTHNGLSGIQGGATNEYYHLTNAEYAGTGTGVFVRKTFPDIRFATTTQSGDYTATLADYTVRASGTTTQTITLPDATTCTGKVYNIKKVGATSSQVIVDAFNTQLIDGSLTAAINVPFQNLTLQSNGTGWDII